MRDDFTIDPVWSRTPRWVREERRSKEEGVLMADEDTNVLHLTGVDENRPESEEDAIERSEIGLPEKANELPSDLPDTPGNGMYWGGGDVIYLNYGPVKRGRVEEELEKEKALKEFVKWKNTQMRGRGLEEIEEEEIKAAIRDGRMKYKEKEWIKLLKLRDELTESHGISEEEWIPRPSP